MAPTQLSIVLERLLNELGIADLSTLEAMLKHDTGAVLDAIRSTTAAAEAGAAVYASSATSNVVVCPSSTATAGDLWSAQRQHLPHSRQHRRANRTKGLGHPCSRE